MPTDIFDAIGTDVFDGINGEVSNKRRNPTATTTTPVSGESLTRTGGAGTKDHPEEPATEEATPKYKHGSTQANIPVGSDAAKSLDAARAQIAEEDLSGDGRDVGGNHITVRWGLRDTDNIEPLKKYLSALSPFWASLGATKTFPPSESSDGAAVVYAPVNSPEFQQMNRQIGQHGDFEAPSFASYLPHATVGYVLPGKAKKYEGLKVTDGKRFRVESVAITGRDGEREEVILRGARRA